MIVCFFDTETTGFPFRTLPLDSDRQPHLTQFAGALIRDDEHVLASVNLMVRPKGWEISEELQALTGITMEDANRFGRPEAEVFGIAFAMLASADVIVAHNVEFDLSIMQIAAARHGSREDAAGLGALATQCTMRQAGEIIKMAPTEKMIAAGFAKHKTPNLSEAYAHFFDGAELQGAHNAMADVMACRRIWMHMRGLQ